MSDEHRDARETGDDVATLLRLAGKRAPVPEERAARVRAFAREHWRQAVRARRRRRILGAVAAAAALAALAAAAWWLLPYRGSAPATVLVEKAVGPVSAREPADRTGIRRGIGPGDRIRLGSTIDTGETGHVALRLESGHSVRLRGSTRLDLPARGWPVLVRGTLYVDSGSVAPAGSGLGIRTPLGTIRETGTQYEVHLEDETLRVRLREGSVEVRRDGGSYEVDAGQELELDERGGVRRGEIAGFGPEWDWLAGATPMLDLDGRTVDTFLAWLARERGLHLVYADEDAARTARETVLSGSSARLTLGDALDAVLPTCRMVHEIDGGTLLVDEGPGG